MHFEKEWRQGSYEKCNVCSRCKRFRFSQSILGRIDFDFGSVVCTKKFRFYLGKSRHKPVHFVVK